MAFSANFTGVSVDTESASTNGSVLYVKGRTDAAGKPDAIHIVVIPAGGMVFTTTVEAPGLIAWDIPIPVETAVAEGSEVFLVGVATRPGLDPFVWEGGFVVTRRGVP